MAPVYIWERPDWPRFRWDRSHLFRPLARVAHAQGRLLGRMEGLGFDLQAEAELRTLTEDVLKSSEIEGERLDPDQVRSSIARHLGMDVAGIGRSDRDVEGVVQMMLDATREYRRPLTPERLFDWHAALFPTGRSGMHRIRVGDWRDDADGPMQVVSGPIGRRRVHYQAPPAQRIPQEMGRFLDWFRDPGETDPLIVAGVAHAWFVTIHPFDDGNGRIARAIADMALARAEQTGQRFYSMSSQLRAERNGYYDALEAAQKGDLDLTGWLEWFVLQLGNAIDGAQDALSGVIAKSRFWERHARASLGTRQIKVLNRLLEGFDGRMTTSRWARIAKCSQDTAHRDILDLVEKGAMRRDPGGGRSTSYSVVLPGDPDDPLLVPEPGDGMASPR